jgi:hypothetical protein
MPSIVSVLDRFKRLEELRIAFIVDPDTDHGRLLHDLLDASPRLTTLALTLGSQPTLIFVSVLFMYFLSYLLDLQAISDIAVEISSLSPALSASH